VADTIPPPTIEEQIAAAERALFSVAASGGVTSYAIGGRQITKDWRGMREWLDYLRALQGPGPGGGRNYVSFARRR